MGNECKYTNCIIGKLKICHMVVLNSFFFFLCKSLDKHIERAPVMGGFSGMVKTKPPYQLTLGTRLVRQKPVQCQPSKFGRIESQVVLVVKNQPADTGDIRDMGLIPKSKDPLKQEMATHSSMVAWGIPRTEEAGGLSSTGSQRFGLD